MMKKSKWHSSRITAFFDSTGLWYGGVLGLLIGVLIAGPHFREWSFEKSMGTIAGCGLVLALLGFLALTVALGAAIEGNGLGDMEGGDSSGPKVGDND